LQIKTWLLFTAKSPTPYLMVPSPTPYDLPLIHNTARLAYHSALWPFKVSQDQLFFVIWKPICYFPLVVNSNLGPVSHRLATIHPLQTDKQQTTQRAIAALQHGCSWSKQEIWANAHETRESL